MGNKRRHGDGALMGGVPKIVILLAATFFLILIVIFAIHLKGNRTRNQELLESERKQFMADAMLGLLPVGISRVSTVFVIPGGGPGLEADEGYPQWTHSRSLAAVEEYRRFLDDSGGTERWKPQRGKRTRESDLVCC